MKMCCDEPVIFTIHDPVAEELLSCPVAEELPSTPVVEELIAVSSSGFYKELIL